VFTLTQFLLLTTIVLVVLTGGAALTHERVVYRFWTIAFRMAVRIEYRTFKVMDDVWEAVHTSEWTPGRLGNLWLRFVNRVSTGSMRVSSYANKRLMAMENLALDDDGSFVEAD